uniref:Putative secreted protein n=1 Tax=Ixodes ricinus TaxID=34613 RepID=A0A147BS83_IXORI
MCKSSAYAARTSSLSSSVLGSTTARPVVSPGILPCCLHCRHTRSSTYGLSPSSGRRPTTCFMSWCPRKEWPTFQHAR